MFEINGQNEQKKEEVAAGRMLGEDQWTTMFAETLFSKQNVHRVRFNIPTYPVKRRESRVNTVRALTARIARALYFPCDSNSPMAIFHPHLSTLSTLLFFSLSFSFDNYY